MLASHGGADFRGALAGRRVCQLSLAIRREQQRRSFRFGAGDQTRHQCGGSWRQG